MSGNRDYTRGDRAALISLSAGTCYWPACSAPIVQWVEGTYKIALEIAHICALKPTGERYDPKMTDEERDAFSNLIFLCHAHHQVVDERGAATRWPADQLRAWKEERERSGIQQLRGLRHLTEDRLAEMIGGAVESRDEDVKNTLARLEQSDAEAADLMKELRDELHAAQTAGSAINVDAVEMLYHAAGQLSHLRDSAELLHNAASELTPLEGNVSVLREAADKLGHLPTTVENLQSTTHELVNVETNANALQEIAHRLSHLPTSAERLQNTVGELTRLEGNASILQEAAGKLAHLPVTAEQLQAVVDGLDRLESSTSRLRSAAADIRRAVDGLDDHR
ncbi:hypothetical protein [Amycolatopsis sp. NPDC098790]|uniref:hypothetical protein n=1 Tax=Amycolatopsis sp. NPDC098790 TaxID=3363939 RepID=UPI0038106827